MRIFSRLRDSRPAQDDARVAELERQQRMLNDRISVLLAQGVKLSDSVKDIEHRLGELEKLGSLGKQEITSIKAEMNTIRSRAASFSNAIRGAAGNLVS